LKLFFTFSLSITFNLSPFGSCKLEGNLSKKEEKYFDNFQFLIFNYFHIVSMMNTSKKNKEEKNMNQGFNFYDMWKDYYSQSSKLFDEKISKDFPSEGMGQILEMNLQFKKMIDESTLKYLEFMNVPSRQDIANISSLIVNVDAKVDDLEERLEEKLDQEGIQESVSRELSNLKKDMKSLDNKLNQILTLIKSQEVAK
jgi:polyhydroxyalkanoic acid synthase PhaR subunit